MNDKEQVTLNFHSSFNKCFSFEEIHFRFITSGTPQKPILQLEVSNRKISLDFRKMTPKNTGFSAILTPEIIFFYNLEYNKTYYFKKRFEMKEGEKVLLCFDIEFIEETFCNLFDPNNPANILSMRISDTWIEDGSKKEKQKDDAWIKYRNEVNRLTEKTYQKFKFLIDPRSTRDKNRHLDHKY